MGIYDRDYYRNEGSGFLGGLGSRALVCKWLIVVNCIVFLIQVATLERWPGTNIVMREGAFTDALKLTPTLVFQGEIWRLLTSAFLHSTNTPWHILINMFILWWAGSEVEELRGSREFLCFYLAAAIFSGLVYALTMVASDPLVSAVGASGAVTAVLVLFACHFPNRTLLLMFVLPVSAWVLVALYVAHDLIVFVSGKQTGVAVTGHLGGALFGWLYFKGAWHLTGWLPSWRDWQQKRSKPKLRIFREEEQPAAVVAAPRAVAEADIDEHFEAKLDAVLEKMSQVGKDNLTEAEKQILLRASEIYRRRRT